MIRVAFIGAGRMAHHHLAALKQSRVSATVVGVYDRASDQAQAFAAAAGCPAFTTTGALFALCLAGLAASDARLGIVGPAAAARR